MTQHKDLTGADLHVNKLHATTHQDGGTDEISLTGLAGAPLLGSATTAVTQSASDNSTKVATTAYADAAAAAAAGTYTDEKAQDAVGGILTDSATIDFTYNDGANTITAIVIDGSITGTKIATDVALAGNPTTTTQSAGNDTTRIATTAFVKAAVDAALNGLSWKQAVRAASTANGTLASAFENGDTLDGVTLATGNRILLKNQSTGAENGIYTVNASGAPTRAVDADAGSELVSAAVFVSEGTANADTAWTCTNNATPTLGSTALTFAQIGNGATYTADESTLHLSSTTFSVKAGGVTGTEIATDVALAGNPTTTTQSVGNSTTRIATTAFVAAAVSASTGGGIALLEQHSASSSASLDFTTFYSSTYDEYMIEMMSIVLSTTARVGWQMSTNGGSSYDTTGGNYEWRAAYAYSGGAGMDGDSVTGRLDFRGATVTLSANGAFNGSFRLYNPGSSALYKFMSGQAQFHDSTSIWASNWHGVYKIATAVNAIRLIPSTGNITSGVVRIYGIAK